MQYVMKAMIVAVMTSLIVMIGSNAVINGF